LFCINNLNIFIFIFIFILFKCIPAGYPPWVRVGGNPGVELSQPVAIPVPPERVRVFNGSRSGYAQKYPGVTCVNH
jgi:hypothetical protein